MARVTDYLVLRDQSFTLDRSEGVGPQSERTFTFTPPSDTQTGSFRTSPVLTFIVRAPRGNIGLEVDLNGQRILDSTAFDDPNARAFYEVVDATLVRPGVPNDLMFRVVSGPATADLRISDIVFWFQREPFGLD